MATNIRDVAKAAGVSVATVSKVLNGYTTVNAKTRERVLEFVKELQFQPNSAARSLVGRRSMTIGIFLTTGLAHPFFAQILTGMEQALKATGYDLIYLAQLSWNKDYSFVRHCQSRNVEGVVVFGFQHEDMDFEELIESGIPTLFIDLDVKEGRAGYISSDNQEGIKRAVAYIVGLNHRRIAFLSGTKNSYVGGLRLEGYREGLKLADIPYSESYVAYGDFTKEAGYERMKELLALPERPTAVICCSDMSAVGAMDAIRHAGLSVPGDISVIGFDDIELASHVNPPLTTVRQDTFTIGKRTIELVDELINDEGLPPPEAIVPTELVIRGSCGPAPE
ncbi:LacI family transcriptional regulator [Cohnella endophytica]|uniref:LacI family transcriptional regulator n=1 Tax=Cohnella endophytica TaxID=2419778 RepID=A0A494XA88_9BACL|nr:LacI family DNA-binding transcriptional regulator [Cohnella endophytica]RKP44503.1 LacI family transcriptional regulator [Cohnella endophytica]